MTNFDNGRYVLDADGNPVPEPDLMKWAEWMEKAERHVALEVRDLCGRKISANQSKKSRL